LVIAELRVRARANQDRRSVGAGQDSLHGRLEAFFEEFVGEHRVVPWLE
jgi:hypothetical protein